MTEGHRNHLFASLPAVEDMIRQMEKAGRDGRSPASGQALTPLESEEWETLAAPLARMQGCLQEAVRRFAPERLAARSAAEGRAATLYWLSVLLRRLEEEIVDDLAPVRMGRKFGPLTDEDHAALAGLSAECRACIAAAQARIEVMRQGAGGQS